MKGDNELILRNVDRLYSSLRIPPGMLGPELVRLVRDGLLLFLLANDTTRVSFRRERIQNLKERNNAQ